MSQPSPKELPQVRARATCPAIALGPDASLEEAAQLMRARSVTGVPVVANGELRGVLASTDVLAALGRVMAAQASGDGSLSLGTLRVRDAMSSPALTVELDASVRDAARSMTKAKVHRLVVVEPSGAVAGILSARDLVIDVKEARSSRALGTIMTTQLETVGIGDPLREATERLARAYVHGLVVLDGTRPVGVFTHTQALALRMVPNELRDRPVEESMSYETLCLDESTPIYRAAAYMTAMRVRRILVTRAQHLAGIVSPLDLIGTLAV